MGCRLGVRHDSGLSHKHGDHSGTFFVVAAPPHYWCAQLLQIQSALTSGVITLIERTSPHHRCEEAQWLPLFSFRSREVCACIGPRNTRAPYPHSDPAHIFQDFGSRKQEKIQGRKTDPTQTLWSGYLRAGGVFHVKGWEPTSSECPSKPGKSNFLAGYPGILPGYPGGARKGWEKKS